MATSCSSRTARVCGTRIRLLGRQSRPLRRSLSSSIRARPVLPRCSHDCHPGAHLQQGTSAHHHVDPCSAASTHQEACANEKSGPCTRYSSLGLVGSWTKKAFPNAGAESKSKGSSILKVNMLPQVLAGALRDNGRGKIVGEPTFGKGLIQTIVELSDGSGVAVTVARYQTPDGTDINKKGIQPDILLSAGTPPLAFRSSCSTSAGDSGPPEWLSQRLCREHASD